MVTRCPTCGFQFKGRPADYLRESPAARRLKRWSVLIIVPVMAAVFVYLKCGATWFGLPTAFTGMANALMLVMVSPSVILYALALRLPLIERYSCRSCGWTSTVTAVATATASSPTRSAPPPTSSDQA